MFHSRLDSHLADMRPELDRRQNPPAPFTGPWPPAMAHLCRDTHDPIAAFRDAWDLILALDYKPIFETGRAALQSCPPDPAFADDVRYTADAALAVVQNIASLRATTCWDASFIPYWTRPVTTARFTPLPPAPRFWPAWPCGKIPATGRMRMPSPSCASPTRPAAPERC